MNKTTTYVLLGLFAALLIYVLAVQQPADNVAATQTATAQVAVAPPKNLWSLTVDQVVGVTIADHSQGKTTSFSRPSPSESWTVTAPEARPADQLAIANQVATLGSLSYASEITSTTDLSSFEVLSPTIQISVTLANGTTYRLDVGALSPINSAYYAVVNGQAPLYTVYSSTLASYLSLLDTPYFVPTAT